MKRFKLTFYFPDDRQVIQYVDAYNLLMAASMASSRCYAFRESIGLKVESVSGGEY